MKLNYAKIRFILIILVLPFVIHSQNSESMWTKISKNQALSGDLLYRNSEPVKAMYYELNVSALTDILNNAPKRRSNQISNTIASFPNAKGNFETFRILEASVLHPDLQERHQNIRSYVGQGIENPANLIRFSITPQGLHTLKFSAQGGIEIIDPFSKSGSTYVTYAKADLPLLDEVFGCSFENQIPDSLGDLGDFSERNADDGNLRDFRLAIASTIEYSSFHWMAAGLTGSDTEADKKAAVLAEMVVLMTRVNGIYERDLSITMTLIANNEDIIFIDSDNFSNSNAGSLINESQSEIDAIIGSANYDIGHTVSTGGGGLAGLGVVCVGGNKGRGITGLPSPVGDVFYVDFVSHEMGHQFGANHSFNGSEGNCSGGNRNSSTAYEPGSGNTIMAYAGICGSQNVQTTSDAFFHQVSLLEIWNFVSTGSGSCATLTPTGNLAPTAEAGASYTIPISTPYMLVGSSTDGDGTTTHTVTWEEYDLGPAGVPTETTATGPMVRSFEGTSNPIRYIPRLQDIIASGGVSTTWEKLPSISRDMDFKLTVRDNDSRGGQNAVDNMTVTTSDTAGPFIVTSQTTNETWNVGSTQTITWDVASTDVGTVNTPNVDVLLSTDGGLTFPFTAATGIPNSGSESITIPVIGGSTTTARVMVKGNGNIFFSVNTSDFEIQESEFALTTTQSSVDVCSPTDAIYNFTYNTFSGFSETTNFTALNVPAGATATFSPTSATTDATAVQLTISGIGALTTGSYTITVEGAATTVTKTVDVDLNVFDTNFATSNLTTPANGATDVSATTDLTWDADPIATEYDVEVASDGGFTTIVESATANTNSYTTTSLMSSTQYFWRVLHKNGCGSGTFSPGQSFTTAAISCQSFAATDTPITITTAGGVTYNSVINIQDDLPITDVNVTIDIDHTYVSDLNISLQSPAGTIVDLTLALGGSGDNYTNTIFDDDAASSITSSSPPFTGTFQPLGTLADFNGEMTLGDWTLIVTDTFTLDGGFINNFEIELCVSGNFTTDTDNDGVIDTLDNCVSIANADQADLDTDGIGDVCDDDMDGDGVLNVDDNCPDRANADQADADTDGIGDVCDIECQSFTTLDTPVAISTGDGATYTAIINIADDLPVDDVNVTIDIEHTWISDLFITLQSPSGTIVDLTLGNGGSGDNYTNTVFDDDGGSSITGGSPPFTGTFQPEGNLYDFNGESTTGDWTLTVTDTAFGDGGVINLFELELCVVGEFAQDTDGDGVNDLADNCIDIANADQADNDGDGLGDVCDDDIDGDGVLNDADNCPETANPDQGDLNGNGIGDFCDVECEVTTSGDTPITIAGDADDTVTYTANVEIMENVIISDINVAINIAHAWDSDLNISLRNPSGNTIALSLGNGGSGDNYTDTVFDQEATTFITSGSAPFTGSFVPEGDLSTLYGDYAQGTWSLLVTDTFGPFDGGTINSFTLEVCGIRDPIDWDVDGVPNTEDNCLYVVNPDQSDVDGDGQGDECDDDIDNDGVLNADDNCAYYANSDQSDVDGDGLGDACDIDMDNDTYINEEDNCPMTPNEDQSDVDGNGKGDACDGLIVNDVLSPNSDGYNDTWTIVNIERFQDAKINVYNRWGNEVFSTNNYNNNWNGTSGSSGNALPTGSYFYQIDQNGDGTVMLSGWLYITY